MGKSSFINRIRNIKDNNNIENTDVVLDTNVDVNQDNNNQTITSKPAKTGGKETTREPNRYFWDKYPNIQFIDFPGFGTFEIKDYEKVLNSTKCDFYILIHSHRLELKDVQVANIIISKLKKPFLTVRSNTESHIDKYIDVNERILVEAELRLFDRLNKDLDSESKNIKKCELVNKLTNIEGDGLKMVKKDSMDQLNEFNSFFQKQDLKKELLEPFHISCKEEFAHKYEMKQLNDKIIELAPQISEILKERRLICGKSIIREKTKYFLSRIDNLAWLSGLTDFVPFGGVAADIAIIIVEVMSYKDSYGLSEEKILQIARYYNVSNERAAEIGRVIGLESKYLNIKNLVLSMLSAMSIGLGTATAKLIFDVASTAVGIATFGVGTLVLGLISGPISFFLTRKVLMKILCMMEYDTLLMIELMENYKNNEEDSDSRESNDSMPLFKTGDQIKMMIKEAKNCAICDFQFRFFNSKVSILIYACKLFF